MRPTYYEEGYQDEDIQDDYYHPGILNFAEPDGRSALRMPSSGNPRNQSCPTCGAQNVLTTRDVSLGYQCNYCADRTEGRREEY